MSLHVIVIGGGLGGLCLAQGLRKSGISVAVYERDPSLHFEHQGYRIHIDPNGSAALADCLPPQLYDLFVATSNRRSTAMRYHDHRLNETFSAQLPEEISPTRIHTAANRLTLREILAAGLTNAIHFGCTATRVEQTSRGTTIHFDDGTTAEGDVLVAADGINSIVRTQLLPDAALVKVRRHCIFGKLPLTPSNLDWAPRRLFNGFNLVRHDDTAMVLAAYRTREPFGQAISRLAPEIDLTPQQDYVMFAVVVPEDRASVEEIWDSDGEHLRDLATTLIDGWHPDLIRLVQNSDTTSLFPISVRTSIPVEPWPPTRITFLGDAIHAMTPAAGSGANTALHDAQLLTDHLAQVEKGTVPVGDAIAAYETTMREYSANAVRNSARRAEELMHVRINEIDI